ncbi:nucleoside/nucleotide kinase family protein [Paenibacillus tarimensis]|uniref:guanylate kinase n=1 Tax=Paenibacillus tarimensis TaxID=416012 RepID=UPI001F39836B|nr:guanylate kinase [Paenibacillus tarimensis]MCF2944667.1 guanylate kinase [Paenibacillus tarimensis]
MWNWLKRSRQQLENNVSGKGAECSGASGDQPDGTFLETQHEGKPALAVIVITGSSGAGRKQLAGQLSSELGLPYIRSYTTRSKRPGEEEGRHYRFVGPEQFDAMQQRDEFFQFVKLGRGSYGIKGAELRDALEKTGRVIVVVNREGALAFKKVFGDRAMRVFIYTTKEDLLVRMQKDRVPEDIITEYMEQYTEQVHTKRECEIILQNREHSETVNRLLHILGPAK